MHLATSAPWLATLLRVLFVASAATGALVREPRGWQFAAHWGRAALHPKLLRNPVRDLAGVPTPVLFSHFLSHRIQESG